MFSHTGKVKRGVTLPFFLPILLKSQSGHLNIDPKQYAKYQDPSSSGSIDVMLTWFSYCYNSKVRKRSITLSIFYGIQSKVNQVINTDPKLYAKYKFPSSSGPLDIVLKRFFFCYNGIGKQENHLTALWTGFSKRSTKR